MAKEDNNKEWTVEEWIAEFYDQYFATRGGSTTENKRRYIQQCCAGQEVKRGDKTYKLALPIGWKARKWQITGQGIWMISRNEVPGPVKKRLRKSGK